MSGRPAGPEPAERQDRIAAIVLAAGEGRRFGGRKLLAPIQGVPMVRLTVERVLESAADDVVVVLGSDAAEVGAALSGLAVRLVSNDLWPTGQASSIAAGVEAIESAAAAVIVLGDQPGIESAIIDRLITAYREIGKPITVPAYEGQHRPPVLFDRSLFHALRSLEGDRGARQIVDEDRSRVSVIAIPGPAPPDIDTAEDYRAYLEQGEQTEY